MRTILAFAPTVAGDGAQARRRHASFARGTRNAPAKLVGLPWESTVEVSGAALGLASLALAPWLGRRVVLGLPDDFLVCPRRAATRGRRVLRVAAGLTLAAVGVVLLFLPGPGLLLIAAGVALADLPAMGRVVRRVMMHARVLAHVNEVRVRHGRSPLRTPPLG